MKKMIYMMLMLICSFSFLRAQSNEDKKQISAAVTDILKGFQTKNADLLNQYVNEKYGVGILFRSAGDLGFVLNEEVDFGMSLGYIQKAWAIRNQFPVQFGQAPEYDRKNKKWKKEGLSAELNSNIVNTYADQFPEQYSVKDQEIFRINADPKNTAFVTLAENSQEKAPINGFRCILTKIGSQWYLTFIDVTEYDAE